MIAAIAVGSPACSIGPGTAAGYAIAEYLFPGGPNRGRTTTWRKLTRTSAPTNKQQHTMVRRRAAGLK